MADDLDDEWWLEEGGRNTSPVDSDGSHAEVPDEKKIEEAKERKGDQKQRVQHDKKGQKRPHKSEEIPDESKTKKKKKKKNITQALAEQEQQPLQPDDLLKVIDKHFKDKMSAVEKEEIVLSGSSFLTCNDLTHTPNSYLVTVIPKWKKMVTSAGPQKGAPLLIILCGAALRASQLNRDISEFKGSFSKSCKLFSKHVKLKEQVSHLSRSVVHVGVGTPRRIQLLIEEGALQVSQLSYVVLDWSWRDVKQRHLVDIKETRTDLMNLLAKHIIPLAKKGQTKIGLL